MSHLFQTKMSVLATHARMVVSVWTACRNTSACVRMSSPDRVARCVSRVTLRCCYNAFKFPPNPHNIHPIDRPWVETWGVFFSTISDLCFAWFIAMLYEICYIGPCYNDTRLLTEEFQSDMNARPTHVRAEPVYSHITPVAFVSCLLYFECKILLLVYEYINKLAAVYLYVWLQQTQPMMTSSNGSTYCVTGLLCGEFTGHRWIPHTKASDAEFWYFLWSAPE